jgi:multiple sugar transport system ATP-binding protein
MNLYDATIIESGEGHAVEIGSHTLAMDDSVMSKQPSLRGHVGTPVVVGIRPEDMEDASVATGHPADQQLDVTIDIREALGAETLVHFALDAKMVDSGDPDALDELGVDDESRCTARFSAATRARPGDRLKVNVTTASLHFFDKTTRKAIRS